MNISEVFQTANTALLANKVRSSLTMLGVIIGVCAVILLISIGTGIQNYISDQFAALGSNLVFVAPGRVNIGSDPDTAASRNKLEQKHVDLLQTNASDVISEITGIIASSGNVKYKTNEFFAIIYAMNANGRNIMNYEVEEGRFFTDNENRAKSRVLVIGPNVKEELFGTQSAVGKKVKLNDDTYSVIGSFKSKGEQFDNQVIAPLDSIKKTFDIPYYSNLVMKVKDEGEIERSMKQIRRVLLRDLKEDDFTVLSQTEVLDTIQSILGALTLALGSIAGISLVVGGIGIMNIMLVSVTERTKEIGLRKALGATSHDIAAQFITESTMLSVGGGLVGILLGWGLSFIPRAYNIRTEVTWWAVLLAFGFSAIVGIIFGTYPAVKAGKKDPIEALRYE